MVGKRRIKFNFRTAPPTSRGKEKSGGGTVGRGGVSQERQKNANTKTGFRSNTNPSGRTSFGRSGGKGGGSFAEDFPRRRRPLPNNPHDPTSKDPFMRAGLSMGTNKTKIFKRAGMSMGG